MVLSYCIEKDFGNGDPSAVHPTFLASTISHAAATRVDADPSTLELPRL